MLDIRPALAQLLATTTRDELRTTWHALTPAHRAALRPNSHLAAHAWRILKTTTDQPLDLGELDHHAIGLRLFGGERQA